MGSWNLKKDGNAMVKMQYQFLRDERLRFLSHLNQQRLFQRAFRRANLAVAYSQGFNPHPKMSFALAMAVGLISDCEYGEVILEEGITATLFIEKMNQVLPDGLKILKARIANDHKGSLSAMLLASDYELRVKIIEGFKEEDLKKHIGNFLNRDEIFIEKRNKKKKMVKKEIRAYINKIELKKIDDTRRATLNISLNYLDQQTVKPQLILESINDYEKLIFEIDPTILIHRKTLTITDPF